MQISKNIVLFLFSCSLWSACKKDDIKVFDANDYIYVNLEKVSGQEYAQSFFTFTFNDASITEKKLGIPIKFAGRYKDADRPFTVAVVDSLTTARNGVHFTLEGNQFITAGKADGAATILLKRTEDMKTASYEIMLQLKDNSEFKTGHLTLVKLIVSDRLIQPDWWKNYTRFLGVYSDLKCRLWLEYMNIKDGSDPFSVPPYLKVVFNGIAYVNSFNDAPIKTTMISFRTWLLNDKQDPFDTALNKTVVSSLGTSF